LYGSGLRILRVCLGEGGVEESMYGSGLRIAGMGQG
jgi:hypothetical protein